jgi:hypothetical protein
MIDELTGHGLATGFLVKGWRPAPMLGAAEKALISGKYVADVARRAAIGKRLRPGGSNFIDRIKPS